MRRLTSDLRAAWQFLHTGLRQIDKTASLFPSSRFLVEAMVSSAPLEQAKCVVEFGPGTGAVTEAILKRLPAGAHLHAIELDAALLETTTSRIHDPRLRPHHGSAAEADRLVRDSGCNLGAEAIFSSLGLALMSDALRADILQAAEVLLLPHGVFVQYSYPHAKALTYQFEQGWSRFNGNTFLRTRFKDVQSRMVWLNAPPAELHVCRERLHQTASITPLPVHRPGKAARRRRAAGTRR